MTPEQERTATKKITGMLNIINKFNADLLEYYRVSGDDELPVIGTTIIGEMEHLEPIKVKMLKRGFNAEVDGYKYKITAKVDSYGDVYFEKWDDYFDGLKQDINYQRARLKKAWRVWRSECPDLELESQDVD